MVDPEDEITFFDPEVLYDGAESSSNDRRFWALGTRLSKGSGTGIEGAFDVAVSKTSNPTGDWWIYTFPVPEAYPYPIHLDSANMSVDDDWVYLNGIVRERNPVTEVYRYFNITYIIDKHEMMAGNGVVEHEIQENWTETSRENIDTWVKNGLVVNFSYPPEQYMIDARFDDDLTFDEIDLWRIDFDIVDPYPTKVKRTISLPSGAEYREPSDAIPQLNSSAVPDPFDSRFFTAVYRDGYLWAVHHVRPEDDPRTVIRWYRFAMNGWSVTSPSSYPTLDGWGTIAVGTVQNPIHLFQPSIAVDDEGNAAITYARSAAGEHPSIWMSRTDTTGAFSNMDNCTRAARLGRADHSSPTSVRASPIRTRRGGSGGITSIRNRPARLRSGRLGSARRGLEGGQGRGARAWAAAWVRARRRSSSCRRRYCATTMTTVAWLQVRGETETGSPV